MGGATQLYFDGRLTPRPQAVSKIDASALESAGLGASGIVAIVGLAYGGKPYNDVAEGEDGVLDLESATNRTQVRNLFRAGDLRELGSLMFKPSKEEDFAGAQRVIFVKANPSVQSQADFANADGDAMRVLSRDYGVHTTQVKVTIANASTGSGKKLTVEFEDATETFDLVGNDAKFTLIYDGGSDGATTCDVTVTSTAFAVNFTRADAGQDTGVVQPGAPPASLEVVSADGGDTTQTVTVYGLNASNVPTSASVTLNGASAAAIAGTWNLVTAVVMSATALGTVTLRIAGGGATVVQLTVGQTNKGRLALDIKVKGALTIVSSGASTKKVVIRGTNAAGSSLAEAVTLTGTTPVTLAGAFVSLTSYEVLNVEAAQTLTIAGKIINATVAGFPNLQALKDMISANADFTWVSVIGNPKEFLVEDLDYVTATDILSPATGSFYGRLYDCINELNTKSQIVEAERLTPGTGAPSNASATYLTGGHEGDENDPGVPTAVTADWQGAIDLLKQVFKNTVIVATSDAAIHAYADAHAAFMCGEGKQECDVLVGAAVGESVAQLKARALALNSRHVRIVGQEVLVFNTDGEREWMPPMYLAALIGAMQAGTSVGNPLTKKLVNCLGVRQAASWNPKEHGDTLLLGGVLVVQRDHARGGFEIVRNLTTHLSTSNLAYVDAHVNQATNYAVYQYRTRMERAVGKKGFAGTVKAAEAEAERILDQLIQETIITAYDKPRFELTLDTLKNYVGLSPVVGINFVPIEVSLKPFSLST